MPADPGLQPERTHLAWRRTALTLTGVTALAVRLTIGRGVLGALLAALLLLGWATAIGLGHRRVRAFPTPLRAGRTLPVTALVVAGYAVIGVVLVLTGVGPTGP